jgi:hypothetical protein
MAATSQAAGKRDLREAIPAAGGRRADDLLTYQGVSNDFGIPLGTVYERQRRGWPNGPVLGTVRRTTADRFGRFRLVKYLRRGDVAAALFAARETDTRESFDVAGVRVTTVRSTPFLNHLSGEALKSRCSSFALRLRTVRSPVTNHWVSVVDAAKLAKAIALANRAAERPPRLHERPTVWVWELSNRIRLLKGQRAKRALNPVFFFWLQNGCPHLAGEKPAAAQETRGAGRWYIDSLQAERIIRSIESSLARTIVSAAALSEEPFDGIYSQEGHNVLRNLTAAADRFDLSREILARAALSETLRSEQRRRPKWTTRTEYAVWDDDVKAFLDSRHRKRARAFNEFYERSSSDWRANLTVAAREFGINRFRIYGFIQRGLLDAEPRRVPGCWKRSELTVTKKGLAAVLQKPPADFAPQQWFFTKFEAVTFLKRCSITRWLRSAVRSGALREWTHPRTGRRFFAKTVGEKMIISQMARPKLTRSHAIERLHKEGLGWREIRDAVSPGQSIAAVKKAYYRRKRNDRC